MITLIYTQEIIHLKGPVDETRFFAYDSLSMSLPLVLGQNGDLTTR